MSIATGRSATPRLRIAVVMPRGGAMHLDRPNSMETVARTLAAHSRFRDATTFVCDAGADHPARDAVRTVPAGLPKASHIEAVAAVLRDLDPDIVEYHQQLESSAILARRLPGRIHVLHRHTRIRPPRNPLDRLRYQARLAAFDRLVFVSDTARAEFCADYPSFADRASTVCNPIDCDGWRASPHDRERLIMFSGRAMPEKGFEPFCLALAEVLDREPDWRGALLLGDWERHSAWAQPHLNGLARFGDRVEIRRSASLSEVRSVARRAAVAVTPSFVAEALGLAALEAHAAGAALVSSGRGGLREASGAHAVYVDPPEAPGLVAAISALIADPQTRVSMASAGQQWVEETHSPAVRAAQLDDLRVALHAAHSAESDEGRPAHPTSPLRQLLDRLTGAKKRRERALRIRQLPDRRLLIDDYIPALAAAGGRILWIGCRAYNAEDYPALEAFGAEVWTSDIDPGAARWGRAGRHRTGDVCRIDEVFPDLRFETVICNGVLGYGVDLPDQQGAALHAMAAILRPGGRLLLGWNTDKISDPVAGGLTASLFRPEGLAGHPPRVCFESVTHTYDSLVRERASQSRAGLNASTG